MVAHVRRRGGVLELEHFALQVVSKKGSASGSERNWSEFDFICMRTKKCNRLRLRPDL